METQEVEPLTEGEDEAAGFELHEEEYADNEDHEELMHPKEWWSSVDEVCIEQGGGDDDSDGVKYGSDLDSLCSDDEEQTTRKSRQEYNPRSNSSHFKFKLGMEFPSMVDLRSVLIEEFIKVDRQYTFVFNNKTKLRAKCGTIGCPWTLYARIKGPDTNTVRVNTLVDDHNCGIVFDNRLVTSQWLAKHFIEQFRLNPHMDYSCFKEMVSSSKYSNVSRSTFYRAKDYVKDVLEGSVKSQFAILDDYCKQLISTNPGKMIFSLFFFQKNSFNYQIEIKLHQTVSIK